MPYSRLTKTQNNKRQQTYSRYLSRVPRSPPAQQLKLWRDSIDATADASNFTAPGVFVNGATNLMLNIHKEAWASVLRFDPTGAAAQQKLAEAGRVDQVIQSVYAKVTIALENRTNQPFLIRFQMYHKTGTTINPQFGNPYSTNVTSNSGIWGDGAGSNNWVAPVTRTTVPSTNSPVNLMQDLWNTNLVRTRADLIVDETVYVNPTPQTQGNVDYVGSWGGDKVGPVKQVFTVPWRRRLEFDQTGTGFQAPIGGPAYMVFWIVPVGIAALSAPNVANKLAISAVSELAYID